MGVQAEMRLRRDPAGRIALAIRSWVEGASQRAGGEALRARLRIPHHGFSKALLPRLNALMIHLTAEISAITPPFKI